MFFLEYTAFSADNGAFPFGREAFLKGNKALPVEGKVLPRRNGVFRVEHKAFLPGNEALPTGKGMLPVQNEAFEAESMARDDGADVAGWCERADTHETNAGSFSAEKMFLVGHTSARYYAPGSMNDFRIYSQALTEDEVLELYNLWG